MILRGPIFFDRLFRYVDIVYLFDNQVIKPDNQCFKQHNFATFIKNKRHGIAEKKF